MTQTSKSQSQFTLETYPQATVACFDATCGDLPRRNLDPQANNQFLQRLSQLGVDAVLIGASTGQGHLRTPAELNEWFKSTKDADLGTTKKIALLRPEDGPDWHAQHVQTLVESGFEIAFVRPGTNLEASATDKEVAANMHSANRAIVAAQMALGVYSIPDVSGVPLRPDAVAEIQQEFGDHLVAVKVTESNYEHSTLRFLKDKRLTDLKVVQGWDPFLATALQEDPVRCGVTSGPMSFAVFQYLHILSAAQAGNWDEVNLAQQAVTEVFQSMQDDPAKFADLQRAKYIMGLGQPITASVSSEQVDRVFQALSDLSRAEDQHRMVKSLGLMGDGPYHARLQAFIS